MNDNLLFLSGPLCVDPLLGFLTGGADGHAVSRATLPGYRLGTAAKLGLATLIEDAGAMVAGVCVPSTPDRAQRAKILGLTQIPLRLDDGVEVLALHATGGGGNADWDAGAWAERYAPVFAEAMPDLIMGLSARNPDWNVGMTLARAAARLSGRQLPNTGAQDAFHADKVEVSRVHAIHRGFFSFSQLHMSLPRFEGGTLTIDRELFTGSEALLVLPYDPVMDAVLVVEQFRTGPFGRGDPYPWTFEPVAGLVDAGETPETTAYREAEEEAGLRLNGLERVGGAYPSPGLSTEYYHLFIGIADFSTIRPASGLEAEGEDIRSHILPFAELKERIDSGRLSVLPLLTLALWLDANRARLRAGH